MKRSQQGGKNKKAAAEKAKSKALKKRGKAKAIKAGTSSKRLRTDAPASDAAAGGCLSVVLSVWRGCVDNDAVAGRNVVFFSRVGAKYAFL